MCVLSVHLCVCVKNRQQDMGVEVITVCIFTFCTLSLSLSLSLSLYHESSLHFACRAGGGTWWMRKKKVLATHTLREIFSRGVFEREGGRSLVWKTTTNV